ncbi:hypothetical protein [Crenothrix polyspora]|uniref:UrcA family protein n=1 Tax=Crenothrix polyspora TaxID=360316 RepID=A0A1R4HBH3_9GAMM|nr:hypothetical protein [Crenothrix polyspora]SJM93598.1 exported hypothetical protein [Crenothrix polyspora]
MAFFKKFSLAILIATSTSTFSTVALAEVDEGRIAFDHSEIFNFIINKITIAVAAIDKGSTCEEVATLILEALQASKEAITNELVDVDRMKANTELKAAKKHARQCRLVVAKNELIQAEKMFEAIKIRDFKL